MADLVILCIDNLQRGRWAVLAGAGVLIRCRTKSEARSYVSQHRHDPGNPYHCVLRRWRKS